MNKIIFPLKLRTRGEPVADLQDALGLLLEKGVFRFSDAERRAFEDRLRPERTENMYGQATSDLVKVFQGRNHPTPSGNVDEQTAKALNTVLEELGAFRPAEPGQQYFVSGVIRMATRSGNTGFLPFASVGGLRVRIVDKSVGDDLQLDDNKTGTDEDGAYEATFTDAKLRERGKKRPDLQARVFAGDTFLAASDVCYNAATRETLNVLLDESATAALRSEHETLTRALSSHFNGKLGDLKETDDRQDITYLANKTGWDARAVAMAALADQVSQRSGTAEIPPVFFYALFRAGLPANEETLYHVDAKTLEAVWKKAAEQGVIPKDQIQEIPGLLQRFRTIGTQKLLTGPALAGVSSLKDMLTASGLDNAKHKQFAELYTTHRTDMPTFWNAVAEAFGRDTSSRLQVDGKLGFLTINNAPLMQKLHQTLGENGVIKDPLQLAQRGYHRADKWLALLAQNIPTPQEIPGDTPEAKRANYADYLAAQVRLSYPTASVAEIVKSEKLAGNDSDEVHGFLIKHQGEFEIGVQPVERFIKRNTIQVEPQTLAQVKRLQRVYQITPSDQAMTGLLKRGVDAAYHVVRYQKENFVRSFEKDLGGPEQAALVYDRSQQVHNAVLNIAVSYLTASNAPGIGVHSPAQIVDPVPTPPANAADVIAYSTLENLFGEMDYCACDHCRSILSPAAYLADLLNFIDVPATEAGKENPQAVLLERRPDIQHLPLTCENTNTALPYIDVVNETLEYYIANNVQQLSLNGYAGHDTNGAASEDLLASPQFVMDSAYTTLRNERFPAPLPFHQALENLRRYFDKFEVPLPLAMERLRKNNNLERGANPYGWRDILMEEIGLSRAAYEILTDSNTVPVWRMYGFPNAMTNENVVTALSNAKHFTRRVGITYEEIVAILKTRFVNPNSDLIPKLERLGVSFRDLKALKDAPGNSGDAAFDALLPTGAGAPDPAEYGGDIKAWVKNNHNYARIMGLITLINATDKEDLCSFDKLEFRYANPMANAGDTSTRIGVVEFVRLLRFIRLWKKTGWTIERTDAALCGLYRADMKPLDAVDIDTLAKLDAGFLILLPRLGIIVRVMKALNLTPKRDLLSLLACWSEIGTHADSALYRQMFLNPAMLKQDDAFADDGYGNFLDGSEKLADHGAALRSAFNLTGDEYGRIVAQLAYDANTPLTIPNISAVYRRGWLARKLKLSVRELLLLTSLTGLDPFAAPDPTDPAILRLISLVQAMKDRSLKTEAALYLIWNQDLSGKSSPEPAEVAAFGRSLRLGLTAVETEFSVKDDPDGSIAQARMSLVYGADAAAFFFGLLNDTFSVEVDFSDPERTLDSGAARQAIENAAGKTDAGVPKIAYDDFRKRLSYSGVLTIGTRDAIKLAAGAGAAALKTAVDNLYNKNQTVISPFFARYPELQSPYNAYVSDTTHSATEKRSNLLKAILPELVQRRKRQQALQSVSAVANADLAFTQTFLDPPAAPFPLHAVGHGDQPASNDLLALETPGLSVQVFANGTATGATIPSPDIASKLDYAPLVDGVGNPLPANPTPGAAISGVWRGYLEPPESGFFNLGIETDAGAKVTLTLDGKERNLTHNATLHYNTDPVELRAGTLYPIELKVEKVRNVVRVQWEWEPKGQGRTVIPARYLYPAALFDRFQEAYVRFLKAASLATGLGLTANELAYFATHSDYRINGDGWFNALPVSGNPADPVALLKPFQALLDYARIKADLAPDDERLLAVLKDPAAATASPEALLYTLTRWDAASLTVLLNRFGGNIAGLSHLELFVRVYDAFALIRKMGISGVALIDATTNEPVGDTVRDLQAALRARYDAAAWRDVVRPINDAMRGLQRDALVSYILHQMRSNPATAHIDTADKLFEYFLMDVEMEPCMQTSRIRHALSSVQLFIERCLMNLEPRVSPAAIIAKQWGWRNRYRVWEANRKVFLFPENWLEPELRDDKSPFFKEIESELLQSDITEDSAATALLNYLSKLEEVAKLEPCGIFHLEGDPNKRTGDVDHVIARTAGAHRKYYYRRREGGSWTPWEQITLDIEDNPVIPVVWKGRPLLFWLRILKQAPLDTPETPPAGTTVAELDASTIIKKGAARVRVQAVLCWSEYYNGKWQPTKTSDVDHPAKISTFDTEGQHAFNRSESRLSLSEVDGVLRVQLPGLSYSFLLYNTHSLPLIQRPPRFQTPVGYVTAGDTFTIKYGVAETTLTRAVLTTAMRGDRTVEPRHPMKEPFVAPFFYEDSRHVFYVTTKEEALVWMGDVYGFPWKPGVVQVEEIPPLVLPTLPPKPVPESWGNGVPVFHDPGNVDPVAPMQRYVTEDAYIRRGIATTVSVKYGDSYIGPSGKLPAGLTKK